ncbi:unnamed protein product [Prorocentrum cordatum]|uniref:Uncharacterized protein n=1 Tax=Prorocentrum cordatum TaxID=2364126 RepID=A0ABN9WKY6_9DINO|nr:unnamed protein product [Polarella glacialis]
MAPPVAQAKPKEKPKERAPGAKAEPEAPKPVIGIGATVVGLKGEVWGKVERDGGTAWFLESGRMVKKETVGKRWKWQVPKPAAADGDDPDSDDDEDFVELADSKTKERTTPATR